MTNGLDIEALMLAAKAKLEADDYFADRVTVNTENDGDLAKLITNALARLKVHVQIGDVQALDKCPNVPSPCWFPISFTAVVSEKVVTNRSSSGYKTAMLVANQVAEVLKGSLSNDATTFGYVATKSMRRLYDDKQYLVYEVEFQIGE
jgi:hypothetical protein